jgi:ISXO2-like transposase domain
MSGPIGPTSRSRKLHTNPGMLGPHAFDGRRSPSSGRYVKPAKVKAHRRDRRFAGNQSGHREVVVIIRECGGNSVPAVSIRKAKPLHSFAKGTTAHIDEASAWDHLHERFEIKRINHQEAYSLDGACTHLAEEYVPRLRRAELGIHDHIAGSHPLRYAKEPSWREDNRKVSNGDQVNRSRPQLPLR